MISGTPPPSVRRTSRLGACMLPCVIFIPHCAVVFSAILPVSNSSRIERYLRSRSRLRSLRKEECRRRRRSRSRLRRSSRHRSLWGVRCRWPLSKSRSQLGSRIPEDISIFHTVDGSHSRVRCRILESRARAPPRPQLVGTLYRPLQNAATKGTRPGTPIPST